jgi:cell division protein FtsL
MNENQQISTRTRLIIAALLLLFVAYLSRQAIRLKEAEDAHHEEAEEYFRKLQEEKELPQ